MSIYINIPQKAENYLRNVHLNRKFMHNDSKINSVPPTTKSLISLQNTFFNIKESSCAWLEVTTLPETQPRSPLFNRISFEESCFFLLSFLLKFLLPFVQPLYHSTFNKLSSHIKLNLNFIVQQFTLFLREIYT